jgi:hypothetical protein
MRLKAVGLALALGAMAMAVQTGIKLERKYKKNDRDNFDMAMKLDMGGMPFQLKTVITQTVTAVHDNGDADITMSVSDIVVNGLGKEEKRPGGPPTTTRLTKFGLPTFGNPVKGLASFMVYATAFGDKELKVGDEAKIDYADPQNPSAKFKGIAKVDSLEAGVLKVTSKLDVSQPGMEKPMHIESVALIDVATAKPNHIEGMLTNIKLGGGGSTVDSATFSFDRKR